MKKTNDAEATRTRILLAALRHVAFDGWTDTTLTHASDDCKVAPQMAKKLFPRGALDLALFFSVWADKETLKRLNKKDLADMRVRDRVTLGVRARLDLLHPHKKALAAALSYLARPPRGRHLPSIVWATADMIWRAAGDTSTDYNHYTKRILLSGVLTSVTLYWLNDDSPDHDSTWAFLDRRIDHVLKIGKVVGKFKNKVAGA